MIAKITLDNDCTSCVSLCSCTRDVKGPTGRQWQYQPVTEFTALATKLPWSGVGTIVLPGCGYYNTAMVWILYYGHDVGIIVLPWWGYSYFHCLSTIVLTIVWIL